MSGGPFDGQVLQSPRPVFEILIKYVPEDETQTVDINELEIHTYRDVDAEGDDDLLTWCQPTIDPFSLSF